MCSDETLNARFEKLKTELDTLKIRYEFFNDFFMLTNRDLQISSNIRNQYFNKVYNCLIEHKELFISLEKVKVLLFIRFVENSYKKHKNEKKWAFINDLDKIIKNLNHLTTLYNDEEIFNVYKDFITSLPEYRKKHQHSHSDPNQCQAYPPNQDDEPF